MFVKLFEYPESIYFSECMNVSFQLVLPVKSNMESSTGSSTHVLYIIIGHSLFTHINVTTTTQDHNCSCINTTESYSPTQRHNYGYMREWNNLIFQACRYIIEFPASIVTRQMERLIWFKSIDQLIPKHSLTLYVLWPVLIISRVSNFPHWVTSLQGLGCRCMNSNLCRVLF